MFKKTHVTFWGLLIAWVFVLSLVLGVVLSAACRSNDHPCSEPDHSARINELVTSFQVYGDSVGGALERMEIDSVNGSVSLLFRDSTGQGYFELSNSARHGLLQQAVADSATGTVHMLLVTSDGDRYEIKNY